MNENDVTSSTTASQEVVEMLNTVAGIMQRLSFWVDSTDGPRTWKTQHPCLYDHLIMLMPFIWLVCMLPNGQVLWARLYDTSRI